MKEKNTRISYLYRDGGNYKTFNSVVVKGTLSADDIKAIMRSLDAGEFFIPRQVGLPEDRGEYALCDLDHAWFELGGDDFEETDAPETVHGLSAKELVDRFKGAKGCWNDLLWTESLTEGQFRDVFGA